MAEELQVRVHGDITKPVLVYLPGLHGDWTLVPAFGAALAGRVCFVELTYPRSLAWKIEDYANAIEEALLRRGLTHGWLLGESFGSQITWALMDKNLPLNAAHQTSLQKETFTVEGIILAGGFVKHPWKWGPGLMRRIGDKTSMRGYGKQLHFYRRYMNFRHRHSPEARAGVEEFAARRTDLDRQAMRARLHLLDEFDPRVTATQTRVPVHYLAGSMDPLVPWVLVRWWLRRNCPGYRGGKTFWLADHNVLATAPKGSAEKVIKWMMEKTSEH